MVPCSKHGDARQEGCDECLHLFLKEQEELVKRQLQEELKARLEKLEKINARFPTFSEIAKRDIRIAQLSIRAATGHRKAAHKSMKCPAVELPRSFWEARPHWWPQEEIYGEFGTASWICSLLTSIVGALGLEDHIWASLAVPVMDTVADVALRLSTDKNKIVGHVKCKTKPSSAEEHKRMFGSDTEVAGEMFEHVAVSKIHNRSFSVALLTNLQTYQLVSSVDISNRSLSVSAAKDFFDRKTQSTGPVAVLKKATALGDCDAAVPHKKIKLANRAAPMPTKTEENLKKGSAACSSVEIVSAERREIFATEPVSFGKEQAQNRKVFELLACYVLLCVESLMEHQEAEDLSAECSFLSREINGKAKTFSCPHIKLPGGILWDTQPQRYERSFYAIRQIGNGQQFGQHGLCSLACTRSCAPCAVKFYRKVRSDSTDPLEVANYEMAVWKALYGDLGFDFVQAYDTPRRPVLVMPFLRVPATLAERQKLLFGGKESLLYQALVHIAEKGYIHTQVAWRHVGLVQVEEHSGNHGMLGKLKEVYSRWTGKRKEAPRKREIAIFCDLSRVMLQDWADEAEREAWLKECCDWMQHNMERP